MPDARLCDTYQRPKLQCGNPAAYVVTYDGSTIHLCAICYGRLVDVTARVGLTLDRLKIDVRLLMELPLP